jgi:uncharacterized protein
MKTLILILAYSAATLVVLKVAVVIFEPKMTFYPTTGLTARPDDYGMEFEAFGIETCDGETVQAWWMHRDEARADILYFHGNAGNLSLWLPVFANLYQNGFNVAALDYRGYGDSTGSPTEEGIRRDSAAFIEHYWRSLRDPESQVPVLYFGRSLGGFTAAFGASLRQPDGVVLEATFGDKTSILRHYPVLRLLGIFSRYRLDTQHQLEETSCPVLVIHGTVDRIVPFEVGRRLFDGLSNPKRFYAIEGAGHNDLASVGGNEYWRQLELFLTEMVDGLD